MDAPGTNESTGSSTGPATAVSSISAVVTSNEAGEHIDARKQKLAPLSLFTSDVEEIDQVTSHLQALGCCVRCVLRLMGEGMSSTYLTSTQELEACLLPIETKDELSPTTPCPTCLGILQEFADVPFFNQIVNKIKEENYEFADHQCSLIVPVSLIIRQRAIEVTLKKKFPSIYGVPHAMIPSVKDVWKWCCGPRVGGIMDSKFQSRASFDILLTFSYQDSDKECAFLLDTNPDFKRRKQRKYQKGTYEAKSSEFGFETFTRANVARALSDLEDTKFEANSTCPPAHPKVACQCVISCSHTQVYVAGRYQKYSRTLCQSPWFLNGKRLMEGSVEEWICNPMKDMFRPTDSKLSSSGREDVDVRMLGSGRPFVIELINPHASKFTKDEIAKLQQRINASTKDVQVRDLQIVTKENTDKLKQGEEDKTKTYTAYCWCERKLEQADVDTLNNIKDLVLHQKTPLRVLHRRTAVTRDRTVHKCEATIMGGHTFKLVMTTQAGTYIKEFVHGDFGRTSPNMTELLHADCDITALDVESVDVDWPPFIDPIPAPDHQNGTGVQPDVDGKLESKEPVITPEHSNDISKGDGDT